MRSEKKRPRRVTKGDPDACAQRRLTAKEERFVLEYLVDCNARRAAQAAGYSARAAKQTGHKLLARPAVAAAIGAERRALAERLHITIERTLRELATVGYAPRGYVEDRDKVRALAWIGKHLGIFVDRHEFEFGDTTFTLTFPETAGRAREKIEAALAAAGKRRGTEEP
jgi:hypothetical protein